MNLSLYAKNAILRRFFKRFYTWDVLSEVVCELVMGSDVELSRF